MSLLALVPSPDPSLAKIDHPWSQPADALLAAVQSNEKGLTGAEASARLVRFGANTLSSRGATRWPVLLLSQFKSPIVALLLVATLVSAILQD